jgi:Yip1 domain.
MNLFERVKQIIISPKSEWQTIDSENTPAQTLLFKYLLVLALIPAVASFIGFGIMETSYGKIIHIGGSIEIGIRQGIISYVSTIFAVYLASWVIGFLAPSFGSEKNFGRAFTLVVYSYTPSLVAGVVLIFPALAFIQMLAGIYGLYILYLGLKPMMKTPDDKQPIYFLISLLVIILVSIAISAIFAAIFVTRYMM